MVMAGQSFGYVVTREPTQKRYLYKKLLFLDKTSEIIVAIVYTLMSFAFVMLGSLMARRLKNFSRKYRQLINPILQATLALTISLNFVGLRYFLEHTFN